jgi:hypothetical protein
MSAYLGGPLFGLSTCLSSKLVVTSTLVVGVLIIVSVMPWFWRKKLAFAGKVCDIRLF